MNQATNPQVVISRSPKNPGIAVILAFFFGWVGMLYASVGAALKMLALYALAGIVVFVAALTGGSDEAGAGALLMWWPINGVLNIVSLIWAYRATKKYNRDIMAGKID